MQQGYDSHHNNLKVKSVWAVHSAATRGGEEMEHLSKEGTSRSSAAQFTFSMAGQDSALWEQRGLQQKWAGLGHVWPSAVTSPSCKATGISCQVTAEFAGLLILQMFSLRLSPTKCKLNAYLYTLPKMFRDTVDIANPSVPLLFAWKMQNRLAWFNELQLNWKMLILINFLAWMRLGERFLSLSSTLRKYEPWILGLMVVLRRTWGLLFIAKESRYCFDYIIGSWMSIQQQNRAAHSIEGSLLLAINK